MSNWTSKIRSFLPGCAACTLWWANRLRSTMIERSLLAHQSVHAAHPGRKLRIFDVQFDIHRKLAEVTLGAQVVGASHAHRTDDRQDGFGADFLVLGVVATSARQLTLIRRWGFEL